jgi:hypothetical protein
MDENYYGLISIASNILGIIGYFPEIYSTIYDVEVKITTKIWAIWVISGLLGITYGVVIENKYVIMSSCIGTGLNIILFGVKRWKAVVILRITEPIENTIENTIE